MLTKLFRTTSLCTIISLFSASGIFAEPLTKEECHFIEAYSKELDGGDFLSEFQHRLRPDVTYGDSDLILGKGLQKTPKSVSIDYINDQVARDELTISNILYFTDFAVDVGLVEDVEVIQMNKQSFILAPDETRVLVMALSEKNFQRMLSNSQRGIAQTALEDFIEKAGRCTVFGGEPADNARGVSEANGFLWYVLIENRISEEEVSACLKEMLFSTSGLVGSPFGDVMFMSSDHVRENGPELPEPLYLGYTERERIALKILAKDEFYNGQSYEEADEVAEEIITTECAAHQ